MALTIAIIQIDLHRVGLRNHIPALLRKRVAGIVDHSRIIEFQSQFNEALIEKRISHIPDHLFIQYAHMNRKQSGSTLKTQVFLFVAAIRFF